MSASKNKVFQTTSFLSKSNSSYIEQMYEKFCNDPNQLPDSWKQYFDALGEEKELINKEKNGASWAPKKIKSNVDIDLDSYEKFIPSNLSYSIEEKIHISELIIIFMYDIFNNLLNQLKNDFIV